MTKKPAERAMAKAPKHKAETEPKPKEKQRVRKFSPRRQKADWVKVKTAYVTGVGWPVDSQGLRVTQETWAKQLGISYATLRSRIEKEGWAKEREKFVADQADATRAALLRANVEEWAEKSRREFQLGSEVVEIAHERLTDPNLRPILPGQEINNLLNAARKGQQMRFQAVGLPPDGVGVTAHVDWTKISQPPAEILKELTALDLEPE